MNLLSARLNRKFVDSNLELISCPPPILILTGGSDTRYLMFQNFNALSLFFNTRFSGESGCKDTTIFETTKYFFTAGVKIISSPLIYRQIVLWIFLRSRWLGVFFPVFPGVETGESAAVCNGSPVAFC